MTTINFEQIAEKLGSTAPQVFGEYVRFILMDAKALEFLNRYLLHDRIQRDFQIAKQFDRADQKQVEIDRVISEAKSWYADIINDESVKFDIKFRDFPVRCLELNIATEPRKYKRFNYNLAGRDSDV